MSQALLLCWLFTEGPGGPDRVEPTCGWCARNERVCEYKERKKPGLRAGYGRELEGRIDRLEALIRAQGARLEDHIQKHDASSQAQSTTLSRNASAETPRHGGGSYGAHSEAPRHDSVTGSGWPQVHGNEHAQYRHQPEGISSPLLFAIARVLYRLRCFSFVAAVVPVLGRSLRLGSRICFCFRPTVSTHVGGPSKLTPSSCIS